jgi:hypothetical protein
MYRIVVRIMVMAVVVLLAKPPDVAALQIVLGPEVVASVNADGGRLRVEPAVAIADSLIVVSWNDSWAGREYGSRIGVAVGWAYSLDTGRTFTFGGYLPDATETGPSPGAADSWLTYDGVGTIYLQILHWPDEGDHEIRVYALDTRRPDRFELRGIAAVGTGIDKPAMTAGPNGEIVTVYSDENRIHVVSSQDGGRAWTLPALVSGNGSGVVRSGADVAVCGDRMFVGWTETGGVWTAVGTAGRFEPPQMIQSLNGPLPVPDGYALGLGPMSQIPNNVYVTCPPTGESRGAPVYITYAQPVEYQGEDGSRAVVQLKTSNEAVGWTDPENVASASGRYQAFPTAAATEGGVAFLYYDWRDADGDGGTQVYATLRTPGGSRDVRITEAATSWTKVAGDPKHAVVQRNMGDYISIAGQGNRWAAAWTDGRTGRSAIMVRTVELQ